MTIRRKPSSRVILHFRNAAVTPNEWIGEDGFATATAGALATGAGVLMTPRRTDTDGFYLAMFNRIA